MAERILGQCDTSTFADIEHLVDVYGTSMFDPSSLKRKHNLALALVAGFVSVGLSFKDCQHIKQVLFWQNHIEFKFYPGEKAQKAKQKVAANAEAIMNKMADVLKGG